jgi:hypothetical protein
MIVGAGLAGLVAAYTFPRELVYEAHNRDHIEHQALLRFRSAAVSDLTGIPFKRVMVRKGIWLHGRSVAPSIDVCNAYAQKAIGRVVDRSIWDISSAERWVPPMDLQERMHDALGDRISWECPVDFRTFRSGATTRPGLTISTVPLGVLAELLLGRTETFEHSPIITTRTIIPKVEAYQTIYFPDSEYGLYRASLTGDVMTCEWIGSTTSVMGNSRAALMDVADAFGIPALRELLAEKQIMHEQRFGKLFPISESLRKALVIRLTDEFNIYSLGRFATWRNLLLDDVVHDAAVIKRILSTSDYDRRLGAH